MNAFSDDPLAEHPHVQSHSKLYLSAEHPLVQYSSMSVRDQRPYGALFLPFPLALPLLASKTSKNR